MGKVARAAVSNRKYQDTMMKDPKEFSELQHPKEKRIKVARKTNDVDGICLLEKVLVFILYK